MGVDVFLEDAEYRVATIGSNNPATEITPGGYFSNFFEAGFKGGVGGIAASGRTAFDAINSMEAMPFDILPPSSMMSQLPYASRLYQDLYQAYSGESLDDQLKAVEEWSKLDPREVGSGGQVFGSLTRGVTIFGLGSLFGGPIGGASNLGLTEGYQTYRDLQGEGVDSSTAIEAAATVGATSFIGAFLPVSLATKSILGAVASGAAINTAFGAGARESIGFVLEQNGYPELAQQYRALDAEAIAADLILGAAFGGVSRLGLIPDAPVTSEQIMDAMERLRQAENARGAAGIPKDLATAKLDAELQDRALASVLMGKDVSIDGSEAARIADNTIIDPQSVALQRAAQRAARDEFEELVEFPDDVLPTRPAERVLPDEFTGTITGVHGSERPLDSIKPAAEVDAENRYDGDGGVWGDSFYSADSGDYSWFRGSDINFSDFNFATVVESTFSRAAIFTPETTVALLKRLGVKGVDTSAQLAQILRDKGYDGAIVRQFTPAERSALVLKLQEEGVVSDTFIDQGGDSMFMNQIVHFAPDKSVRIIGEDATMGPLVRERRKLTEELNAKAEARGFAHANDAYGTIYDVEQYAGRRDEIERQNHDYALKMAGDRYPRAKEFADETATETARLKELDRKILELAKPRPAERVLPDEIPVTPEVDVEAAARAAAETAVEAARQERPIVAGTPYFETRGGTERFHGTSKPITQLARGEQIYDSRNIYGQGFYTTDAVDISMGYTKKDRGGEPTLYRVIEQGNPRFYDMEAPIPDNVRNIVVRALGDLYFPEDDYGKPITSLRGLYDQARAESKAEGYTRDDVQGMFDDILVQMQQLGYDGFLHIGGRFSKKPEHAVKIYWTPEKHVKLELVDPASYTKPETVAKAPQEPETAVIQSLKDFDPVVREQIDEIAMRMPDMDIKMPDGSIIKASEFKERLVENIQAAQRDSRLFDVAVACFLRTE